jgi:hypothetical protein
VSRAVIDAVRSTHHILQTLILAGETGIKPV